jgi:signal transduction histidine kinase
MARSNRNLLAMVNTLLEVYRYEAGRKNLLFAPVDLRELLKEVVQEITPLADEKELAMSLEVDDNTGSKVLGDRLELHRVFTNLIGNAIKFTDRGEVVVRVKSTNNKGNPAADWVIVEVQDTGPGIAPQDREVLFERFRQGSHKRSGSGLGLHLSRRIAEAHQGTLEVMSEVGKGSVFVVRLPSQR